MCDLLIVLKPHNSMREVAPNLTRHCNRAVASKAAALIAFDCTHKPQR